MAAILLDLVFLAMLAQASRVDLERRLIPNRTLAIGTGTAAAILAAVDPAALPGRALWALGAGGLLLLAAIARPDGMGLGDVKLLGSIGFFLGSSALFALLIALACGSGVGIAMVVRTRRPARQLSLPFGPFLALGAVLAMVVGADPVLQ